MININEMTVEQVKEQYFKIFEKIPEGVIDDQTKEKIFQRVFGHLNCPNVGMRINPIVCTVCPVGHVTECHFPFTCDNSKSECSHHRGGH